MDSLLQRHQSRPYNPKIARAFFRAGYIESWGRGIQKIVDVCKEYGTSEPEYIVHSEDIMIKLSAVKIIDQSVSKLASKADRSALNSALKVKVLKLLEITPTLTQKELQEMLNETRSHIQIAMKDLVSEGVIERKGGKKSGFWEIHK